MFLIATIKVTRAPSGALEIDRSRLDTNDPIPTGIVGRLDDGMGVLEFIAAYNPQQRPEVDVCIDFEDIGYTPKGDA